MKIMAAVMREKGGQFKREELELDEPCDNEVLLATPKLPTPTPLLPRRQRRREGRGV